MEAESQYAIKEALQGLRNLRVSGDIRMLPLKEMPGIFNKVRTCEWDPCFRRLRSAEESSAERRRVREVSAPQTRGPKQALPQRGDFVRVKRGVYAGDLAQVISADEQGVFVTARLIPRLDIVAMLDKEKVRRLWKKKSDFLKVAVSRSLDARESFILSAHSQGLSTDAQLRGRPRRSGRPEKRFFDRDQVDASGGQIEQGLSPGTVRFGGARAAFPEERPPLVWRGGSCLPCGSACLQGTRSKKQDTLFVGSPYATCCLERSPLRPLPSFASLPSR